MNDFDEETAEHDRDAIDHAVEELEALSQRRIALEAIEEMMD